MRLHFRSRFNATIATNGNFVISIWERFGQSVIDVGSENLPMIFTYLMVFEVDDVLNSFFYFYKREIGLLFVINFEIIDYL